MQRKFNLAEAAKYLAGDSSPIPARRMRELARLITHVRISKREWLFMQSDLDAFLARHRFEARTALPAKPTKNGPKNQRFVRRRSGRLSRFGA